jgi:ATPase subunit of ABC transporter with duplicated ATPase domains
VGAQGTRVGYLPQEPQLDPTKDVRGNVEEALKEQRRMLDRFNEISAAFAEPDADFEKLMDEQARCRSTSTRTTCGTSTTRSRWRWTRCACRPATPT